MSPFPSWIFATLLDKSSRRAHTCGIVILNFPGLAQQLSCSDALMADTCVYIYTYTSIYFKQWTSSTTRRSQFLAGTRAPCTSSTEPHLRHSGVICVMSREASWGTVTYLWHAMPLSDRQTLDEARLSFQSHSQCLCIMCPLYICPARVSNQSSRSNITAWFCAKQQLSEPRIPQQISGSVIAVTGAASLGHWLSQAFWYDQASINVATWPNEVVSKEKRDCHLWPDR